MIHDLLDRVRPLLYHLFVAAILGGLWVYADTRRQIGEGQTMSMPPINPELARRLSAGHAAPVERGAGRGAVAGVGDAGRAGAVATSPEAEVSVTDAGSDEAVPQ